ncbi:MAG: pirin family protein [Pseudonocardiaceae bacterium]
MEIVTWVLSGSLEHKDSQGNRGLIYPRLAQRMSAGTGIWHSEMNPSGAQDVHPGYQQLDINAEPGRVPLGSLRGPMAPRCSSGPPADDEVRPPRHRATARRLVGRSPADGPGLGAPTVTTAGT